MNEVIDEFEFFFEKPWSDGLPVIPPTEERIARILTGTKRDPEEVLGTVPPQDVAATVRQVALHAIMAGCKPEYLPVVIAGVEALLVGRFNVMGLQGTMHGSAPLLIVNGPYGRHIGLHGGSGCFGPGFRANATIGRAIRLILLNLGGGIPCLSSMSTFGQPSRYTFCIRENEEESPWEPLSVTLGYGPEENVVSVVACENPKLIVDDVSTEPERLFVAIADQMTCLSGWNIYTRSDLVVALAPDQANLCAQAGLSKADVHRCLREQAVRRLGEIKRGGVWMKDHLHRRPFPDEPDDDDYLAPAVFVPEDLKLIVAGGSPGPMSAVLHGWNGGSQAVSRLYEV